MAKKPTAIKVHYWKTNRKGKDVWKVAIDDVSGPSIELKERYTRPATAKRGGLRKVLRMGYGNGLRPIEFINANPAK